MNCDLRLGDMNSMHEEYLKDTETALECSKQAHVLRPSAIGMTWSGNSRNCFAEVGVIENTTSDTSGCLSCKTCSFSKLIVYFNLKFLIAKLL